MEILRGIPSNLAARASSRHVAVLCNCGVTLLWEKNRGNEVRHGACGATAKLNIDGTLPPEIEVVDGVEQVKAVEDGSTV